MQKKSLEYIAPLKLLLLLGVVLIHSDVSTGGAPFANRGIEFSAFVTEGLAVACVPVFFIVSGYLFFLGVDKFSLSLYRQKLKRRFTTLFIPYLAWNTLCALLFVVKAGMAGFNGLGIIDAAGRIDWLRFAEGFWMIPQIDDMPFAFAFWFIRNLMCIAAVSPLLFWIGRSWLLTVLVIAVTILTDEPLFGAEFFVIGACLSLHRYDLMKMRLRGWRLVMITAIYVGCALAIFYEVCTTMYMSLRYILVLSGFVVFLNAALRLRHIGSTRPGAVMIGATFWIYALHQCFCSFVRKFWLAVVGDSEWFTALLSYGLSFLTLVGVSVLSWLLMRRFAPRALAILTGDR